MRAVRLPRQSPCLYVCESFKGLLVPHVCTFVKQPGICGGSISLCVVACVHATWRVHRKEAHAKQRKGSRLYLRLLHRSQCTKRCGTVAD